MRLQLLLIRRPRFSGGGAAPMRRDVYYINDTRYTALRQEIIETHRSSADFLKWKLFAVAAVASVAMGYLTTANATPSSDARLIICLAPFVCAYADMVATDLAVR